MANQHHPSDSGRRPLKDVLADVRTCDPCTWVFVVKEGKFWLKQVYGGCRLHMDLLAKEAEEAAAEPLADWLLGGAA